jgi:site-specific recombinase XerD
MSWRTPDTYHEGRHQAGDRHLTSTNPGTTSGTFLNWLVSEGVLDESPMLAVPLLKVHEAPAPAVFSAEAMRRLTAGTRHGAKRARTKWLALRDETMLSLLADSGLRASECAGLLVEHLNLPARQVYVHAGVAKGRRPRTVAFGFQTARLLNRYMRERDAQEFAFLPQLFIGQRGPATYNVVRDAVRKAGLREGVIGARPHLFRHTWAHDLKSQGVDTEVLMSDSDWVCRRLVGLVSHAAVG